MFLIESWQSRVGPAKIQPVTSFLEVKLHWNIAMSVHFLVYCPWLLYITVKELNNCVGDKSPPDPKIFIRPFIENMC